MSITSDLRSYADTAVNQGKQALETAQAQLNEVSGTANDAFGKYRANVTDIADKAVEATSELRTSVEKAINLEAIKAAIEPYLAQAKSYGTQVTDRAEDLFSGIKGDKRVAKLVDVSGVVVETVQERVVKPVVSLTGIGAKPAAKKSTATRPAATKPATPKPAAKPSPKATAASTTTTKATAPKPATKSAPRRSPAKKAAKA
ncbi:MAG TPA: hypothetical protein VGN18_11990 [Jatrophihabitans sp.]|jgi:uncharacterized phage infection (PIP) family protein YhgE|uniref:hypothetical protein n=1 Tax=Jatrophihabitans sp. TaxID=1932789 RepID=UPI002DFF5448|nr:hypothetical protein [Jatrophihabitans sp.]